MSRLRLRDDQMCFACGGRNEDGLRLRFEYADGRTHTRVSFPKKFQGYRDVVHGGLLSTVLDEAMVTLINRVGFLAVTAELTVRFVSPLAVDEEIEIVADLDETRGKYFRTSASAVLADGTIVATATATCVNMGPIEASIDERR